MIKSNKYSQYTPEKLEELFSNYLLDSWSFSKVNAFHCTLVSSLGIFVDLSQRSLFFIFTFYIALARCHVLKLSVALWPFELTNLENQGICCQRYVYTWNHSKLHQSVCLQCLFCQFQERKGAMPRYQRITMHRCHCWGYHL